MRYKLIGSGFTKFTAPSKREAIIWKSAGKQSGIIVMETGTSISCLKHDGIQKDCIKIY